MNRGCRTSLLTACFVLSSVPFAFGQGPRKSLGEGTHIFRRILHEQGLRPLELQNLDRLKKPGALRRELGNASDKILIVLGDSDFFSVSDEDMKGNREQRFFREFVTSGGALLLASDRSTPILNFEDFGVAVNGILVRVPDDSPSAYRKSGDCIFVEPAGSKAGPFQGLEKVDRVATNLPSYLQVIDRKLQPLAYFPKDAHAEPCEDQENYPLLFAAGGDLGAGRVLILSDHSVFINAMLLQNDNGNYFFAENCVQWLSEGKRTEVLFFEDGSIETKFNIPMRDPELPPLDAVVAAVDQGMRTLEEENRFNPLLAEVMERFKAENVLHGLLVLLTLGVLFYGLARLSSNRQRFDVEIPLLENAVLGAVSPLGIYEQRSRALLRQGNYYEAARNLIQKEFGSEAALRNIPVVAATDNWRQRWRCRRLVRKLWRIGYGPRMQKVSANGLAKLKLDIQRLAASSASAGEM
jgi:hypothetical protein